MSTTDQILINLEDEVNPNEDNSGKRKNYDENSSVKKSKTNVGRPQTSKKLYQYFDKKGKDGVCLIENCKIKTIATYCNSNLKKHLERHHQKEYQLIIEYEKSNQINKSSSNQIKIDQMLIQEKYKDNEFRQIKGEKLLSYLFNATKLEYDFINCKAFRMLINFLDPKLKIPGLIKIENIGLNLQEQMNEKIKNILKDCNFITLATDLWTTKNMRNSYLALTCHYFDNKNIKNENILLCLSLMNQKHSSENIKKEIEKVLEKFEINFSKVLRIITDNGSNLVKCFKTSLSKKVIEQSINDIIEHVISFSENDNEIDKEIEWDKENKEILIESEEFEIKEFEENESFQKEEKSFRIPCYAHTLQLVVNEVVKSKEINSIASKLKKLAHKINKSQPAMVYLQSLCDTKPPGFCPTRWSSLFNLINWFFNNEDSTKKLCENFSFDHLLVTEWSKVGKIIQLLKPFAQFTKLLEGNNINTLSIVIPSLILLESHLNDLKNNFFDKKVIDNLKNQLQQKFVHFKEPNSLLFDPIFVSATVLDPKFALCLSENQIKESIKFIELTIKKIPTELNQNEVTQEVEKDNQVENNDSNLFSPLNSIIINSLSTNKNSQKKSKFNEEMKSYIQYLKEDFLDDFKLKKLYFGNLSQENDAILNVFKFWTKQSIINKFPLMSKIACDILAIPASQASCERTFSISGNCLNTLRNSLSPIKLEKEVMFIYNEKLLNL